VAIDSSAPSADEKRTKMVTKARYMSFRDDSTSSAMLGYRIEGTVVGGQKKDYKEFAKTKTADQVKCEIRTFLGGNTQTAGKYFTRLNDIKKVLERSSFFKAHELIGSSLFFVHDDKNAKVWLIDFGKTHKPNDRTPGHSTLWKESNDGKATYEDGYLVGLGNLIKIFEELKWVAPCYIIPSILIF